PLGKTIAVEELDGIIKNLVARHETLRTSFIQVGDEPFQQIHDQVPFKSEYYDLEAEVTAEKLRHFIHSLVRPFDLSRPPLLRSSLIRMAEGDYIWFLDIHHIVTDGTSQVILTEDFFALSQGKELAPLALQYKDFSHWQNRLLADGAVKAQQDYWLSQFTGEIPRLDLPVDYERPGRFTYAGTNYSFMLDREEAVKFRELGDKAGATLFMNILAVLNVLFYKYTGQTDIIIGSGIAGRLHADLQDIVGMFFNTLPMRNYPVGEKTYEYFLKEVKDNSIKGFENQDVQFEDLVEKLDMQRDLSRNPLFDVFMLVQNFREVKEIKAGHRGGRTVDTPVNIQYKRTTAKFDLTFFVSEMEDEVHIAIEYYTGIFKEESIRRLATHFRAIIKTIIKTSSIILKDIDIISEEEKQQIMQKFNDTERDYPGDRTIHQLFAGQAGRTPDRIAIVGAEGEEKKHLTYKELNDRTGRLACLLADKGVRSDNIVGIMVERSLEMVIGIMGILKSGGAYLPIDPGYPQERIDYMLKDSDAQIIVGDWHACPEIHHSSFSIQHSNLAYLIYTSGSTGKPKGVMIEHGSVVNLLFTMQDEYPVTPADTYLLKTSYIFDVSVTELFAWFMGGGRLAILEKNGHKDPRAIGDSIEKNKVSHINFVPSMFNVFIEYMAAEKKYRFGCLKYIFLAGEELLPDLVEKFRALNTGITLENIYGPTESTVYSSKYSLSGWNGIGNIPIGKPLPNTKLYILNKYHYLQPVGIAGELCISGPGLARGYLNRVELTSDTFYRSCKSDRTYIFYKTGDLAKWLPDGNIAFLGRIDQQVKIRGFRIEPGEIENRLLKHDRVKNAAVVVKKDETGEKSLVAYIVSDIKLPDTELRKYLLKDLPDYMIPAFFIQLEQIPLTANGKINRRALPDFAFTTGKEVVEPRNEMEKTLVAIWRDVLSLPPDARIGIDDNFFQLGGHSLKATVLVSKIHKALNVKIPLAGIFNIATIRELAEYIGGLARELYVSIEPAEKREYYPLSSAQKRVYFLQQFDTGGAGYNIPLVLPLGKEIEKDKLQSTLQRLIDRHESLRTSFEKVDEEVVQRIHPAGGIEFSPDYYEAGNEELAKIITDFIKPFDLSRAPLIRSALIKLPDGNYTWIVDVHHIVSDGVSHRILTEEFTAEYSGKALKPLPIQYKDFALWQQRRLESGAIKAQMVYWLDLLAG
ncbi:MAG TPA: amino acid adenylation domain-containing protein, partial [Candidatus Deferrimicrobium sp.]|nr:amino acid adenylation domain-containing protein [Candidatus Deferrimicrobium sp.]